MKADWDRSVQDQWEPTVRMFDAAIRPYDHSMLLASAALFVIGQHTDGVFDKMEIANYTRAFNHGEASDYESLSGRFVAELETIDEQLDGAPRPFRPARATMFMPLVIRKHLLLALLSGLSNVWVPRPKEARDHLLHIVQAFADASYLRACKVVQSGPKPRVLTDAIFAANRDDMLYWWRSFAEGGDFSSQMNRYAREVYEEAKPKMSGKTAGYIGAGLGLFVGIVLAKK